MEVFLSIRSSLYGRSLFPVKMLKLFPSGHEHPPYGKRTEGDDEGIFQTDDISETEHGSSGVDLEHELRLVGKRLAQSDDTRGEHLVPPSEGGDDEVVESAHDTGEQQRLCLASALGTGNEQRNASQSPATESSELS